MDILAGPAREAIPQVWLAKDAPSLTRAVGRALEESRLFMEGSMLGNLLFRLCYFSWVDNFFLVVLNCLARVI